MAAVARTRAMTRAFARVLGPFLLIVPMVVAVRMEQMNALFAGFFATPALPFTMGVILLFGGLLIIANHQIWSSGPAIVISVLGWLFVLRGVALLAAPELIERAAASLIGATIVIRIGFGLAAALGLWLTYAGWIAPPSAER